MRGASLATLVLLAGLLLSACVQYERRTPVFVVENATGAALDVFSLPSAGGETVRIGAADTGRSTLALGAVDDRGCALGRGYVTRAPDGRETLPRRVCDGDTLTVRPEDLRRP
jgi:hypothetical protein